MRTRLATVDLRYLFWLAASIALNSMLTLALVRMF